MTARVLTAAVLAAAVLVGCATSGPPKAAQQVVIDRLNASTDCAALQEEFDLAERNADAARARGRLDLAQAGTYYMSVADDRMREIGCYG